MDQFINKNPVEVSSVGETQLGVLLKKEDPLCHRLDVYSLNVKELNASVEDTPMEITSTAVVRSLTATIT
jgi:hypothetical protein